MDRENNSHRETCFKEIANLYHEEGFSEKLDIAEDLLCVENRVYDLSTGRLRQGVPEDNPSSQVPECQNNTRRHTREQNPSRQCQEHSGHVSTSSANLASACMQSRSMMRLLDIAWC